METLRVDRAFRIWILVFVVNCFAANPVQDFHGWRPQSVPGLVLDSVKESGKGITFTFKTVSGKPLMGYTVCFTPPSLDSYLPRQRQVPVHGRLAGAR
jgi:hypothetical protein